MKKTNKNSWKQLYVLLAIVGVIVALIFYSNRDKKQKLSNESAYATAKVIDIEERFQKGLFIKYEYSVSGNRHTAYRPLPDEFQNLQVGDDFKVRYSVENPEYNEIVFDSNTK